MPSQPHLAVRNGDVARTRTLLLRRKSPRVDKHQRRGE
jgi:hypothetical protein